MITLEKVDQIRERTGVSYKEAKDALEITGGDVLEAIVYLETKQQKGFSDNVSEIGNDIIESLRELIKKGNVTRILLERDEKVVLDIPVAAGAIGAIFFTPATAAGIIAALVAGCELKIVKNDGEVIDIKDIAEDTISNVREVAEDAIHQVKDSVDELKTKIQKEEEASEEEEPGEKVEVEIVDEEETVDFEKKD